MAVPATFSLEVSSIYIALCGVLLIVLAILVVAARRKHLVGIGDGGIKSVNRAIRAHGNAVEYIPIALLLLVALESTDVAAWLIHTLGCVLVASRIAHAIGLSKSAGTSMPRFFGTLGTWLMILVAAVILLIRVF